MKLKEPSELAKKVLEPLQNQGSTLPVKGLKNTDEYWRIHLACRGKWRASLPGAIFGVHFGALLVGTEFQVGVSRVESCERSGLIWFGE